MTPYVHDIDPIAVQLGPLAIHWYGLMYLAAFVTAWFLGRSRIRAGRLPVTETAFSDLAFYVMLGVILGGRLGYIFFYEPAEFLRDPSMIIRVWEGGMSFHGGLLGVLIAGWIWSRRNGIHFFDTVDFVAPLIPQGLFFGRLGNFIGGELWGRTSDVPWAMIFPNAPGVPQVPIEQLQAMAASGALDGLARHPSQLYQAGLEGVLMFAILWWFSSKPRPRYAVSGLFAILYGCFRIAAEFVRQPDADIGFLAGGWLTMGMLLSVPMVIVGVWLMVLSRRAPTLMPATTTAVNGSKAA